MGGTAGLGSNTAPHASLFLYISKRFPQLFISNRPPHFSPTSLPVNPYTEFAKILSASCRQCTVHTPHTPPVNPYTEFAEILSASCRPSSTARLKGSVSFFKSVLALQGRGGAQGLQHEEVVSLFRSVLALKAGCKLRGLSGQRGGGRSSYGETTTHTVGCAASRCCASVRVRN